ncbi:MAG: sensor histidine kinase [Phycisphaerales bacterium]|nr:sensor histidine kinase [Phycisphaerales bacterium]
MDSDNPAYDVLASGAFPRVADVVRARAEAILRRWEEMVRRIVPRAEELTLDQLRNSVPKIIRHIGRLLESPHPKPTEIMTEASKEHGATRFHQHYNVDELILENRLLRRAVIEEVWEGLGGMDRDAMVGLDMALDINLQQGVSAFIEHQKAQIRAASEIEARYVRFLSYDLRTHLNQASLVIEMFGRKLRDAPEYAEGREDLGSVQRSIHRTTEGMDRLLQAERLRRDTFEPKAERVDLRRLATEVVRRFSHEADGKGVGLVADVPDWAVIDSDRDLIALALQNLVANAVKYSTEGEVRIAVAPWKNREKDGVAISVSDHGPGIEAGRVAGLFDALVRGGTQGQPGEGLGLAMASQAAKSLGGRLEVESTPGVGSTFRLLVSGSRCGVGPEE